MEIVSNIYDGQHKLEIINQDVENLTDIRTNNRVKLHQILIYNRNTAPVFQQITIKAESVSPIKIKSI